MDALLKERYAHVTKVVQQNKRQLLRLARSLLKYETLSGENAKRVMEGKKPVMEKRKETERDEKMTRVYRTMSLVNMFMLSGGSVVSRVKSTEANEHYVAVAQKVLESQAAKSNGETPALGLTDLLNDPRFAKMVKDKYWELLDERSLKDIDWEELSRKYV